MTITILNWRTGATMLTIAEATNCVGIECAGMNLTDADFRGHNVRFGRFPGANLTNSKFDNCKTYGMVTTGANTSGMTSASQDTSAPNYSLSKLEYNAWSVTRVNDVVFRNALDYDPSTGKEYAMAWRRTLGNLVSYVRDLVPTPGPWTRTVTSQAIASGTDGHHTVSFALDGNRVAHVCNSWLDTSYIYWHGAAGDTNVGAPFALPIVPGEAGNEGNPAYPQFHPHSSIGNDLLFTYWSVPVGTMVRRLDAAALTWSTIAVNILHCGFNAYLGDCAYDSTGKFWIPYNWRDSSDITTNHDLGVVKLDPATGIVTDCVGNVLALPVQPASVNNGIIKTIAANTGLINTVGFCLTSADRGVFGYWKGNPAEYYICNQHADGSWTERRVGAQGLSFTLVNNPSADNFPLCQPCMIPSGSNIHMLFRSDTYPGAWCYKFTEAELEGTTDFSTRQPTQLCEYDAVGWAPAYNKRLFRSTGTVNLFMSRVSNTGADLGNSIPGFSATVTLS
jgi:hypothetical protein